MLRNATEPPPARAVVRVSRGCITDALSSQRPMVHLSMEFGPHGRRLAGTGFAPAPVMESERSLIPRIAVHYHVVFSEEGQADRVETLETWDQADAKAEAMSTERRDWIPRRYPGRSFRPGEVAVYLDRGATTPPVSRRELVIVRCTNQISCANVDRPADESGDFEAGLRTFPRDSGSRSGS